MLIAATLYQTKPLKSFEQPYNTIVFLDIHQVHAFLLSTELGDF